MIHSESDDHTRELAETLARVSQNCLSGQPIPVDLAALWRAQLSNRTELLDAYELVLFDHPDDFDALDGFRTSDGVEAAAAQAFERGVHEVCFVAEAYGGLLGYWVGEGLRRIDESPVVFLDAEGQFELCALTFAEALLQWTDPDDPEDVAEVLSAFEDLGIDPVARSHEEIWERLDDRSDLEELSAVVLGYQVEARMLGREGSSGGGEQYR